MKNVYCTYFNESYLSRGIVLCRSLRKFVPDGVLEVLCIDDGTYDFFAARANLFPGVVPCRARDFEARHPDLVAARQTRTFLDYLFTCSSVWTLDVAERNPGAELVTYLDADTMLFGSPARILDGMAGKDILVCSHNYEKMTREQAVMGVFNVGWLTFRNSPVGRECLSGWARDCIAWCQTRIDGDKYADQAYLNAWPARYGDRLAIAPRTLDYGPWSIRKDDFSCDGDAICIRGEPLVHFHFSGLRLLDERHYTIIHGINHQTSTALKLVYEPYVKSLLSATSEFNLAKCRPARTARATFVEQIFNTYAIGSPRLAGLKRKLQVLSLELMSVIGIDTLRLKRALERLFAPFDNELLT